MLLQINHRNERVDLLQDVTLWHGVDNCLTISLLEYGMLWRHVSHDNYEFIYGVERDDDDCMYETFSSCYLTKPEDILKEYDCLDIQEVCDTCSMPIGEFQAMSFPCQINALFRYYGDVDVFGQSYHVSEFFKMIDTDYEESEE